MMNNPDKHTILIPVGYYLEEKIPDFLPGLAANSRISVAQNGRDFSWPCMPFTMNDWIKQRVPTSGMLRQEVDISVDIRFEGKRDGGTMLAVPTLFQLVDVTKQVVSVIFRFC